MLKKKLRIKHKVILERRSQDPIDPCKGCFWQEISLQHCSTVKIDKDMSLQDICGDLYYEEDEDGKYAYFPKENKIGF